MASKNMYFPIEEYHERWTRVYAEMKKRGYEVMVVWGKTAGTYERSMEILYLTNFYSCHSGQEPDSKVWNARSYCAAIMADGEPPELHTDLLDPRYERIATDNHHFHLDPIEGIADALKRRKIEGKIAWVGSDCLPVKYAKQLEAMTPEIEYIYEDSLMQEVRKIKSPREHDLYREGGEMVSVAMNETMEALIMGKTEREAAALGAAAMIRQGGYFQRIAIAHGDVTQHLEGDPMYGFAADGPKEGDLIHMAIYGPIHQGYWFDPVRSAVGGRKPSAGQKKIIEDMVTLMDDIEGNIRHGAKVHDVARSVMAKQEALGYGSSELYDQWPYYGHGNGSLWEPPFLSLDAAEPDEIYEADMVASAEVFLNTEGVGTVLTENNFIITKNGIEQLYSKIPMVWW
jgi:Xaa-Pro aminopeptidase